MTNSRLRELLAELDKHAPGEGSHGERVAVYAVATGHALGMSAEALVTLRYAAALHDIGKLAVDRSVLASALPLANPALAEIQGHPTAASDLIGERLEGIVAHHERWDGEGYPAGLSGRDIPLDGRIIGLAEAFDVLSYGAHWQPRNSIEEALDRVKQASGTAFDPSVVRAFLEVQPLIQPIGL